MIKDSSNTIFQITENSDDKKEKTSENEIKELDLYLEIIFFQFLKNSQSEIFTKFHLYDLLELPENICYSIFLAFQKEKKENLSLAEFKYGMKTLFTNYKYICFFNNENQNLNYSSFKKEIEEKNKMFFKILIYENETINAKDIITRIQNFILFIILNFQAYSLINALLKCLMTIKYLIKKSFHELILEENFDENYIINFNYFIKNSNKKNFLKSNISDVIYDIKFKREDFLAVIEKDIQITNILVFVFSLLSPIDLGTIKFLSTKNKTKDIVFNFEDHDQSEESENVSIGSIRTESVNSCSLNISPTSSNNSEKINLDSKSDTISNYDKINNEDKNNIKNSGIYRRKSKFFLSINEDMEMYLPSPKMNMSKLYPKETYCDENNINIEDSEEIHDFHNTDEFQVYKNLKSQLLYEENDYKFTTKENKIEMKKKFNFIS